MLHQLFLQPGWGTLWGGKEGGHWRDERGARQVAVERAPSEITVGGGWAGWVWLGGLVGLDEGGGGVRLEWVG